MVMVNVVNAMDTANLSCPNGYDSWIDFWNKKKGVNAGRCRHCNKSTSELDGGHVQLVEKRQDGKWYRLSKLYIVPLCKECNNPNNTNIFSVDEGDLIPA